MKKFLQLSLILGSLLMIKPLHSQTPLTEAVDFEVTDIEGNNIHLFDLLDNEGKYVLIDFFFTTCGPCQDAVPKISEAYAYFGCGEFDVEFIAMDYGDTDEECIAFDEEFGVAYPTVSGIEGGGTQVCLDYEIPLFPTVILIAPDHSIVEQYIWPIPVAQVVISALENHGINANECSLIAEFTTNRNDICDHEQIQFLNQSQGNITTFEWTFEGGYPPTSNQENPVVIYPSAGNFDVTLVVTNDNDESSLFEEDFIIVHNCTSVDDKTDQRFSVSPNPSNGKITIRLPNSEFIHLSVYNSSGQLVQNTYIMDNEIIDLSHLKKGIYILKANSGGILFHEKIVIE